MDWRCVLAIIGLLVAILSKILKNSKNAKDRALWSGEQKKNRKALVVLIKHQHRIQELLTSISKRFANSE